MDSSVPIVEVFSKPGCPYCAGLKQKLQNEGIAFVDHNVQADPAALKRMLELNGGRRVVPTLLRGGEVTVGYNGT